MANIRGEVFFFKGEKKPKPINDLEVMFASFILDRLKSFSILRQPGTCSMFPSFLAKVHTSGEPRETGYWCPSNGLRSRTSGSACRQERIRSTRCTRERVTAGSSSLLVRGQILCSGSFSFWSEAESEQKV